MSENDYLHLGEISEEEALAPRSGSLEPEFATWVPPWSGWARSTSREAPAKLSLTRNSVSTSS
jgi:hypothetical protein